MRKQYQLRTVLALLIFLAFFGAVSVYSSQNQQKQVAAVAVAEVTTLTNDDRYDADLESLEVSPVLVAAAQAKADDMASKGYFAHKSPVGHTMRYWLRRAGYQYKRAGENLAMNFSDSGDVTDAWMQSQRHRENVLNKNFTEVGIAAAVGFYNGQETVFVVQMLGQPLGQ